VLYAYVHGCYFRELVREHQDKGFDSVDLAEKSLKRTEGMFGEFFETLKENCWDMSKMLIPKKEWRVNFGSSSKKEN